MAAKPRFYEWKQDLTNYTKSVNTYVINYGNDISNKQLNQFTLPLLFKSNSIDELRNATSWLKLALRGEDEKNPYFIYQMAAINYKLGEKVIAIKELESAISIFENTGEGRLPAYKNLLEKMKAGEKTW